MSLTRHCRLYWGLWHQQLDAQQQVTMTLGDPGGLHALGALHLQLSATGARAPDLTNYGTLHALGGWHL